MTENKKKLGVLVGSDRLGEIQKKIYEASRVKACLMDNMGNEITRNPNENEICIHFEPDDDKPCMQTRKRLFKKVQKSRRAERERCANTGCAIAALPIFIDDELVCIWMLCRFHFAPGNECQDTIRSDEEGAIPFLNESALNLLISFITMFTENILQLQLYRDNLNKMEDDLHWLAFYDQLLGIPNANCMERDLRNYNSYKQLIILDIMDLRKINDVYGRDCGDALLKEISDYIISLEIQGSRLYRLDVADFGILLVQEDPVFISNLAKKLFERCTDLWIFNMNGKKHELFITVNVGVVPVDEEADTTFHNLTSAMEHTLDLARKSDGVAFFDDSNNRSVKNRVQLELSLRHAVRENMKGFYVVYQPIVDPGMGSWSGMEALCRWNSPEFGAISPAEFIPIGETSGLISEIGFWVLEQAISQVKAWQLDKIDNFVLDVNLSPVQLVDATLDQEIIDLLHQYDYPAHKLCLEVTESNELNFSKHALKVINRLQHAGIKIALDDFGTGYASFNSLHKLPVSILKTDRSLIMGVEHDSFLKRLFYVMVEMAHASGMKIVAEGVETDSQAKLLLKEGADYFQGFKFSRPLTATEMAENLVNFNNPSGELVAMGYSRIDLSRLSDEHGGYELTPSLYKLLSKCMQVLFNAPDTNAAIATALKYIGQELGVSRSYVFIKEDNGMYTNTHEWCAPNITPEKENLQNVDIEGISPDWIKGLKTDGMLIAADIRLLDMRTYNVLYNQGIKAVVEFPIWRDNKLFGFVGFDDCDSIHYWTREEIQMLHTLTTIISSTLGKMQLQQKMTLQSKQMINMLNNMDTFIYVSDLETDEVLFANSELTSTFGSDIDLGRPCWEILQNKTERCAFCPVPYLLENPGESCTWEHYNEKADAHFRIRDSIIPWDGDKMAHFEYALNITELKNYQKQLEDFALKDMLTGALNRNSFLETASKRLAESVSQKQPSALAFVDIDGLKKENDLRGHTAGDKLITSIIESIKNNIRENDLIGRYGGDEFLILFDDCTQKDATKMLNAALKALSFAAESNGGKSCTFSFGIAESKEVESTSKEDFLTALIHLADMRMIEYKQENRKNRT